MVISYLICDKAYKTLFSFISSKSEGMPFILINNNYYQFFPEPLYSVVKESITMKGAIGELFGVISVPVNLFLARDHAIFRRDRTKYGTLLEYLGRLSFSSMSGQVAVAVGFLTQDPSLIWNTELKELWEMWSSFDPTVKIRHNVSHTCKFCSLFFLPFLSRE